MSKNAETTLTMVVWLLVFTTVGFVTIAQWPDMPRFTGMTLASMMASLVSLFYVRER